MFGELTSRQAPTIREQKASQTAPQGESAPIINEYGAVKEGELEKKLDAIPLQELRVINQKLHAASPLTLEYALEVLGEEGMIGRFHPFNPEQKNRAVELLPLVVAELYAKRYVEEHLDLVASDIYNQNDAILAQFVSQLEGEALNEVDVYMNYVRQVQLRLLRGIEETALDQVDEERKGAAIELKGELNLLKEASKISHIDVLKKFLITNHLFGSIVLHDTDIDKLQERINEKMQMTQRRLSEIIETGMEKDESLRILRTQTRTTLEKIARVQSALVQRNLARRGE